MTSLSITPKLVALIGTTASGKSDLAIDVAKTTGAHILSCDSLLIYRDLNIGTAKPTEQDMQGIPHYGIDLVNADQHFNAGDYVRYARKVIEDCKSSSTPLIIVGGTGFYLKALLHGIWDAPPTNEAFREALMQSVAHLNIDEQKKYLHSELEKKDPDYAKKINANDVYRVIRALEIIHFSKIPVTELLQNQKRSAGLPYPCPVYGIKRSKIELERRIHERTNKMFEHSLVREVKELMQKYSSTLPRGLESVGYFEVMQFLNGEFPSLTACRERIEISTRQLAKKQRTFFSGMKIDTTWFTLPQETDSARESLLKELQS